MLMIILIIFKIWKIIFILEGENGNGNIWFFCDFLMFMMFLCIFNVIDFFVDLNFFNLWRLKGCVIYVLEGVNDWSVYEK